MGFRRNLKVVSGIFVLPTSVAAVGTVQSGCQSLGLFCLGVAPTYRQRSLGYLRLPIECAPETLLFSIRNPVDNQNRRITQINCTLIPVRSSMSAITSPIGVT